MQAGLNRLVMGMAALLFHTLVQAFPFEVQEQLRDVEIAVDTMDLGDNLAAVSLYNYGQHDARCTVRFKGGPEAPKTRKVRVAVQKSVNVTASFNNQIIRMRVNVSCEPAQ